MGHITSEVCTAKLQLKTPNLLPPAYVVRQEVIDQDRSTPRKVVRRGRYAFCVHAGGLPCCDES